MLLPALVFVALQFNGVLGQMPDWVWWVPPAKLTKEQRLGLSVNRILHMGLGRWVSYTEYDGRSSMEAFGRLGSDHVTIVWADCLRARNQRLLVRLPMPKRRFIPYLERHCFLFGMACIGLEDTLAGGGTYAIHAPKDCWSDDQDMIYALIKHSPAKKLPRGIEAKMEKRLFFYRTSDKLLNPYVDDNPPKKAKVHKYGKLASDEFLLIRSASKSLDTGSKSHITHFLRSYIIDYLGIRGADGTNPDLK